MRIEWSDIVKAARETSEELVGKDWVKATFKANVLLADMADEMERLARERDSLVNVVVGCSCQCCRDARETILASLAPDSR